MIWRTSSRSWGGHQMRTSPHKEVQALQLRAQMATGHALGATMSTLRCVRHATGARHQSHMKVLQVEAVERAHDLCSLSLGVARDPMEVLQQVLTGIGHALNVRMSTLQSEMLATDVKHQRPQHERAKPIGVLLCNLRHKASGLLPGL